MSGIYFYFLLPPPPPAPNTKITYSVQYREKSFQSAQLGDGLDIGVGMTLSKNSVMPQFGSGGTERPKMQNCSFWSNQYKIQNCTNIWKNEPHKWIGKGDMRGFLVFYFEKGLFFPYLPNELSQEVEIWYVGP